MALNVTIPVWRITVGSPCAKEHIGQLHLELEYSRVAVTFNSTYSPEPIFSFKCQIISIVSELRHAHCCVSSDQLQSNLRSCLGPTRLGVKVQVTQFNSLPSLFSWNWSYLLLYIRTLVPDEVAHCDMLVYIYLGTEWNLLPLKYMYYTHDILLYTEQQKKRPAYIFLSYLKPKYQKIYFWFNMNTTMCNHRIVVII